MMPSNLHLYSDKTYQLEETQLRKNRPWFESEVQSLGSPPRCFFGGGIWFGTTNYIWGKLLNNGNLIQYSGRRKCWTLFCFQQVDDPSKPNDEGITPLHNAVCAGHHHIVKFLLDFGVNVNAADSDGW